MNPEQWLSLKWNGGSTMSDRWLNQSKIIHKKTDLIKFLWTNDNSKVEEIKKIYLKYPILLKIKTCINEFRKIFIKCSLPLLYLFMECYEHSKFVPISNFIKG